MVEIEDGWENRWVKSDWKKYENMAGEWNHNSGKWNGDPNDKGSLSSQMQAFSNFNDVIEGFATNQ